MSVAKFRDVRNMPRPTRAADAMLAQRIRDSWNRALALSPPAVLPGVVKFRTLDEANEAKRQATRKRLGRREGP
jgi:hypothetical protein